MLRVFLFSFFFRKLCYKIFISYDYILLPFSYNLWVFLKKQFFFFKIIKGDYYLDIKEYTTTGL